MAMSASCANGSMARARHAGNDLLPKNDKPDNVPDFVKTPEWLAKVSKLKAVVHSTLQINRTCHSPTRQRKKKRFLKVHRPRHYSMTSLRAFSPISAKERKMHGAELARRASGNTLDRCKMRKGGVDCWCDVAGFSGVLWVGNAAVFTDGSTRFGLLEVAGDMEVDLCFTTLDGHCHSMTKQCSSWSAKPGRLKHGHLTRVRAFNLDANRCALHATNLSAAYAERCQPYHKLIHMYPAAGTRHLVALVDRQNNVKCSGCLQSFGRDTVALSRHLGVTGKWKGLEWSLFQEGHVGDN